MRTLVEIQERCRDRGIKLTPQRLSIFNHLWAHPGHPTAEDVYLAARQEFPTLSFATVYNTLQLLVDLGEVREVVMDELKRRYDRNSEHHGHAVCRGCGLLVDLPLERFFPHGVPGQSHAGDERLAGLDFTVETVRVEFTGLCGPCSNQSIPTPPATGAGEMTLAIKEKPTCLS